MGIHKLSYYLNDNEETKFVSLNKFKGKFLGFDGLNYLHHICSGILKELNKDEKNNFLKQNIENLNKDYNKDEIKISIIKKFIRINLILLNKEITPVWIWDGCDKKDKEQTFKKRQENTKKNVKLLESYDCDNLKIDEFLELKRKSFKLSFSIIEEIKNFSIEIGLSNISYSGDAEILGSYLCQKDVIEAFWTNDTDAYALGCKKIIKYINDSTIKISESKTLLDNINLTEEQFLDFCILLGTDYNSEILNLEHYEIESWIRKHSTIENIFSHEKQLFKNSEHLNLDLDKIREKFSLDNCDDKFKKIKKEDLNIDGTKDFNKVNLYNNTEIFYLQENIQLLELITDDKKKKKEKKEKREKMEKRKEKIGINQKDCIHKNYIQKR